MISLQFLILSPLVLVATLFILIQLIREYADANHQLPAKDQPAKHNLILFDDALYQNGKVIAYHLMPAGVLADATTAQQQTFFTVDIFMPWCYLIVAGKKVWIVWADQYPSADWQQFLYVAAKYRQ